MYAFSPHPSTPPLVSNFYTLCYHFTTFFFINYSDMSSNSFQLLFFFFKMRFVFRERGREGDREGNINVWLPLTHPLLVGDLAHNPGTCWEWNWRPFGTQEGTQSTEPHRPGLPSPSAETTLSKVTNNLLILKSNGFHLANRVFTLSANLMMLTILLS